MCTLQLIACCMLVSPGAPSVQLVWIAPRTLVLYLCVASTVHSSCSLQVTKEGHCLSVGQSVQERLPPPSNKHASPTLHRSQAPPGHLMRHCLHPYQTSGPSVSCWPGQHGSHARTPAQRNGSDSSSSGHMFIKQDKTQHEAPASSGAQFNYQTTAAGAPRDSTARKKLLAATGMLLLCLVPPNC